MGSIARLAEEFHSHFTEYEKFDGHAEVSVRLMRRELPQNHWVGYEGLGFDVCEARLRSLTVALPDDKTRGKFCTKHAKYGFYSFNLPECVDECLDSKGRVRERTERVLVRAFNDKVLMDLCALHELVAAERITEENTSALRTTCFFVIVVWRDRQRRNGRHHRRSNAELRQSVIRYSSNRWATMKRVRRASDGANELDANIEWGMVAVRAVDTGVRADHFWSLLFVCDAVRTMFTDTF